MMDKPLPCIVRGFCVMGNRMDIELEVKYLKSFEALKAIIEIKCGFKFETSNGILPLHIFVIDKDYLITNDEELQAAYTEWTSNAYAQRVSQLMHIISSVTDSISNEMKKEDLGLCTQKLWELTLFHRNHEILPITILDVFKKILNCKVALEPSLRPVLLSTAWAILDVPVLRSKFLSMEFLHILLRIFNSNDDHSTQKKGSKPGLERRPSTLMATLSPTGEMDALVSGVIFHITAAWKTEMDKRDITMESIPDGKMLLDAIIETLQSMDKTVQKNSCGALMSYILCGHRAGVIYTARMMEHSRNALAYLIGLINHPEEQDLVLMFRVSSVLDALSRVPEGRKYLNNNRIVFYRVFACVVVLYKKIHVVKIPSEVALLHVTLEHFLVILWSLTFHDEKEEVEAFNMRIETIYNMAIETYRPIILSSASAFLAASANEMKNAQKMLNLKKVNFVTLINKLLLSTDLRTNQTGVWLLRGLSNADDNFRENCLHLFVNALHIAGKGLDMKQDPKLDNLNEEGDHLRELQKDLIENATASAMLLSTPKPVTPQILNILFELISSSNVKIISYSLVALCSLSCSEINRDNISKIDFVSKIYWRCNALLQDLTVDGKPDWQIPSNIKSNGRIKRGYLVGLPWISTTIPRNYNYMHRHLISSTHRVYKDESFSKLYRLLEYLSCALFALLFNEKNRKIAMEIEYIPLLVAFVQAHDLIPDTARKMATDSLRVLFEKEECINILINLDLFTHLVSVATNIDALASLRISAAKLITSALREHPIPLQDLYVKIAKKLKLHRGGVLENIFVSFIYSNEISLADYGSIGIAHMCVDNNKIMSQAIFREMGVNERLVALIKIFPNSPYLLESVSLGLLNMSVISENQKKICENDGFIILLNLARTEGPYHPRLLYYLSCTLFNLSKHKDNRTFIYKAELAARQVDTRGGDGSNHFNTEMKPSISLPSLSVTNTTNNKDKDKDVNNISIMSRSVSIYSTANYNFKDSNIFDGDTYSSTLRPSTSYANNNNGSYSKNNKTSSPTLRPNTSPAGSLFSIGNMNSTSGNNNNLNRSLHSSASSTRNLSSACSSRQKPLLLALTTSLSTIWADSASPYTLSSSPHSLPIEIHNNNKNTSIMINNSKNKISNEDLCRPSIGEMPHLRSSLDPRFVDRWDFPIKMNDSHYFDHVGDCTFCQDLFMHFTLPNGKVVHFYTKNSCKFAPSELNDLSPLPPMTIDDYLYRELPLLPSETYPDLQDKPAVRCSIPPPPPKPKTHKLEKTMVHNCKDHSKCIMFGYLIPERFTIDIEEIKEKEEKQENKVQKKRNPLEWLKDSIFAPRRVNADAKAFFDSEKDYDKAFELDWERVSDSRFQKFLAREANILTDDQLQKYKYTYKRHYHQICSIFNYYASLDAATTQDLSCIGLNATHLFTTGVGLENEKTKYCTHKDIGLIFATVNVEVEQDAATKDANNDNSLMRFEFINFLARVSVNKYIKSGTTKDAAEAIEMCLEQIVSKLSEESLLDQNVFRSERLYTEENEVLLRSYEKQLHLIFNAYINPDQVRLKNPRITLKNWFTFCNEADLLDNDYTRREVVLTFSWSRMIFIDEVESVDQVTSLDFVEFLEALSRLCEMKSLPSEEEIHSNGCDGIIDFLIKTKDKKGGREDTTEEQTKVPIHILLKILIGMICYNLQPKSGLNADKVREVEIWSRNRRNNNMR